MDTLTYGLFEVGLFEVGCFMLTTFIQQWLFLKQKGLFKCGIKYPGRYYQELIPPQSQHGLNSSTLQFLRRDL